MAPPYNTIPAAADEQDSLLAKKDTTKLKRLVAGAAGGALLYIRKVVERGRRQQPKTWADPGRGLRGLERSLL